MGRAALLGRGGLALALAAALALGCSDSGGGGAAPEDGAVPTADEMMGWIEEIVSHGVRRPGYEADAWVERWAAERFSELGLENVELDPVEVLRWRSGGCRLEVWPAARPAERLELPCRSVPYSASADGLELEIAPFGDASVAGRIAVVADDMLALPQSVMRAFARAQYDPDRQLEGYVQVLPFGARLQTVMEPAIEAGARAFVGVVRGMPVATDAYYVPYDAVERPIPGVWLSETAGGRLDALLARGPARARLSVSSTVDRVVSHNVAGTLPGASDEWIVIGSHHDGPWASAVEDASGTALVLAQARYWSRVPRERRPHNLLFLLNAGHMAGGAGIRAFVERRRAWLDRVVVEIHLEHVAREAEARDGRLAPTDRPEVRWWFTSLSGELEGAVLGAIRAEGVGRSLLMPPEGFPPGSAMPPTDGAFFHPAGVPIVQLLAAPSYLFDAADTPEMVHRPSLVPITRAVVRIVEASRSWTAGGLRARVRSAAAGR